MRERGPTRVRNRTRALALAAGLMALMTVARIEAADPPRLDAARIESLRQTATEQASLPKSLFDGLKVDPSQTLPQVLSADQVAVLDVTVMSSSQISAITSDQSSVLSSAQLQGIGSAGISALSAEKISAILTSVGLSSAQLADRKSTRLNSSHTDISRMPSSA